MKKTLFYIFILSLACLNASAQDAFYYYGSEKVPLKAVEGKVAVRTPNGSVSKAAMPGLRVVHTLADKRQQLEVCEYDAGNAQMKRSVAVRSAADKSAFMPCYTDGQGLELWPTGYVSVKLKQAADAEMLCNAAREYGLEVVEQDPFMPLWWVLQCCEKSAMNVIDIANRMQESGKFASASPDFACNGAEISYDPEVGRQWNLYNAEHEDYDINVSPAWNYATGKGVKIAIVDNGVDIWHKDLAANVDTALCYDAVEGKIGNKVYPRKSDELTTDSLSHATHCAGIAAAVRNNGFGVAGVAPDATIMSICCQDYDAIQLARGINWACMNGADIISCSWGIPFNKTVAAALTNATQNGRNGKGCIVVNSAGNVNGEITWPGCDKFNIIVVTATNINGVIYPEACYGERMFVSAPGWDVLSTTVDNGLNYSTGTSMAAPHVAGIIALMLERNPNLTFYQVQEIIARTAKKVGKQWLNENNIIDYKFDKELGFGSWNEHCGYGLVDAYNAVINTPRE